MKWLLLAFWIACTPIVAAHLKRTPAHLRWAAFAMGFIPIMMGLLHLYIAPISRPQWAGPIKGVELAMIDFLAIAIIMATPKAKAPLSVVWPWALYFVVIVFSAAQATLPQPVFYYAWQVARAGLVFYAAFRLASYPRTIEAMLWGLFAAIGYQMFAALLQASSGVLQAGGSVGTQNMLGMMSNFGLCASLALLLRGKQGWWPIIGFMGAVVVAVLTASRATLGFAAIGLGLLLFLSCIRQFTSRKGGFLALVVLIAAAVTPLAMQAIDKRKAGNSTASSNYERQAFKRAAWMIIEDHPLGVGANQYAMIANVGGYSARAGVAWQVGSRATNVHQSYLLVMAETSVFGLLAMLLLLILPVLTAVRGAFRHRRDPRGELLLGLGVAMVTFSLHCLYEWLFVTSNMQYMLALFAGSAIGLTRLLDRERVERNRAARTPPEPRRAEAETVPVGGVGAGAAL